MTDQANFSATRLAEIRKQEQIVAEAEDDWADCKERAKAAHETFDGAVSRLRELIREKAPLLEQVE